MNILEAAFPNCWLDLIVPYDTYVRKIRAKMHHATAPRASKPTTWNEFFPGKIKTSHPILYRWKFKSLFAKIEIRFMGS